MQWQYRGVERTGTYACAEVGMGDAHAMLMKVKVDVEAGPEYRVFPAGASMDENSTFEQYKSRSIAQLGT